MKPTFILVAFLSTAALVNLEAASPRPIRVLVWDEQQPEQKRAYGDRFLGESIAAHLAEQSGFTVKSVSLNSPSQGLDASVSIASFRPGHETYPVFKQAEPLRVLENAARWLAPETRE